MTLIQQSGQPSVSKMDLGVFYRNVNVSLKMSQITESKCKATSKLKWLMKYSQ